MLPNSGPEPATYCGLIRCKLSRQLESWAPARLCLEVLWISIYLFTNYRPISLLPIFSKVIEKVICIQINGFFVENKLFFNHQYGFRSGHSTELAALELTDRNITALDNHNTPLNIFLDLSKAFDTLDHTILSDKLLYYGIRGTAYNLLRSYLANREQFVELNDTAYKTLHIVTGVPQGSILGPLLFFNIYK